MVVLPLILSMFTFMGFMFFDREIRESIDKDMRHFNLQVSRTIDTLAKKNMMAYEKLKRKKEEIEKCKSMNGHMMIECFKNLQAKFEQIEREVEEEVDDLHERLVYIYR